MTRNSVRLGFSVVVAILVGDCSQPDYDLTPFRCGVENEGTTTGCPSGYLCHSEVCVREADRDRVPTRLSSIVADDDAAFSVHSWRGNALVCWNTDVSARVPSVMGAALAPTGSIVRQPAELFATEGSAIQQLSGVRGACGVLSRTPGDPSTENIYVSAIRLDARYRYVFRVFESDFDSDRVIASFPQYPFDELTQFTTTNVADTLWLIYPRFVTPELDDSVDFERLVVPSVRSPFTLRTALPTFEVGTRVGSVETMAGDDGVWTAVHLTSGRSYFAWLDACQPNATTVWIRLPVDNYRAAYPLAVRGREVAVAMQLDDTNWQVYWIETSTMPQPGPCLDAPAMDGGTGDAMADAMADATADVPPADSGMPDAALGDGGMGDGGTGVYQPSMARPGPMFTLSSEVLRPGGLLDGDRLVIAGAIDPTDSTTQRTQVRVWSVPWGTESAPTWIGVIDKLSRPLPRRLAISHVGNRFQIAWSERVPPGTSGFTGYTALWAGTMQDLGD